MLISSHCLLTPAASHRLLLPFVPSHRSPPPYCSPHASIIEQHYRQGSTNFLIHFPPNQSCKPVQAFTLAFGLCRSVSKRNNLGVSIGVRSERLSADVDDGFYMRRCVELAKKAIGCTSPNPMVGCVIVKDGKIVGEGFHPKAGQPHAEVFALRDAGDLAENSTAYVSLEPCNHYGRTPPCTEALIEAKVKRVVVGMVDPNPIVASMGVDKLRKAGVEVMVGVEEELCEKLNQAYMHQMLTGRPFVILRYSLTVDGRFSNDMGEEAKNSGGYYSKLLQEYDAIILSSKSLGEKTLFPSSMETGANQPLKFVTVKNPTTPIQVPVLSAEEISKLVILADKKVSLEPKSSEMGVETVFLNRLDLVPVLEVCKSRGLCSVLIDLRGNVEDFDEILEEGFELNLFQKVVVEVLPSLNGSKGERFPLALKSLKERKMLRSLTSRKLGQSVLLEGYL